MFAHQVIDSISLWQANEDKQVIGQLTNRIICAQQFHVQDAEDVLSVFDSQLKDEHAFHGKAADGVRMPYPLCWFDWNFNGVKKGAIVREAAEDFIEMCVFGFQPRFGRWGLSELAPLISIGKPFKENGYFLTEYPDQTGHGFVNGNSTAMTILPSRKGKFDVKERWDGLQIPICIVNSFLLLLGCKNITTETHDPPAKLNKARQKRGKQPLFTYHTLVLKPVGKKQESIPKHLWNNRIHLQRGHFKTYTQDAPLFGSITGRFWWQPHVRGQNREGVVMKDYEVRQ